MSEIKAVELLRDAEKRGYCVGYFESWDLESTLAVVRAAEKTRSPVMIGFCGEYLANPGRKYAEDLFLYGSIVRQIARRAGVPVATLLNESIDPAYAMRGVAADFDMVMFVDEKMPVPELTAIQKRLVEFAHACGAAVEAELGSLPTADQAKGGATRGGLDTDPDQAAKFVADTGVDALAVAIGNVHLLEGRKAELDLDLLGRINAKVDVPLVLHGGTGVDKKVFKEAVKNGIAKVNVGAGLKRVFINSFKDYLDARDVKTMNPNRVFGDGGPNDIMRGAHDALVDFVAEFIVAFGGENKA